MRLVTAAKASPHAEFYSLNAEHTYGSNNNFFNYLPKTSIGTRGGVDDTRLKAKNTKKNLRPRTQKNPRPRTQAQMFSKKKVFKQIFQAISKRGKQKRFSQIFGEVSGVFLQNAYGSKNSTVLEPRTDNFRGLEASRPRPKTSKCVLEDSTSDRHRKFLQNFLKKNE